MEFDLEKLNDAVYRYPSKTGEKGDRGPQIVFIHGLQPEESRSPYFEPWLTEDGRELWPKSWLSESFPTATMYLVHYDSCPCKDGRRGRMDMFLTAENLLANLLLANVGQSPRNPVILVGHDIGGLVVKEICLRAFSGASSGLKTPMVSQKRQFLRQVKGVFYFSTPHGGFHYWDPQCQGELMANLTVLNARMARSNDDFRNMRVEYKWRAYGLGGSHSLPGQIEVKEASGRYDVDEFCMIDASSMNICRFKDRTSTSWQILVNFIQDTVCGFKNPNRVELRFTADPRYVPLERTVCKIRQMVESPNEQVVVLWGDAGTGKTSLVKYLALQYEEMGSNAPFWDGIFFFDCYHRADLEIMQQMLRELNRNEETISASGEDKNLLEFQLKKRLQNLNALMILDDVWDHQRRSLVEKVVFPGAKEVKYLITSQQSDVWRDYARWKIEKVVDKVAREIIVKNIRDPEGDIWRKPNIPKEDERIVNEIIDATGSNPLALATIASSVTVDKGGRVSRATWEELKRNLSSYLGDEEEGARATAFGKSYPVTVYAAMMNAVDVLYENDPEYLHLLCILALFQGPLLTSVFHMFILCTSEPQVSSQVTRIVKRLQGRGLVQDAGRISRFAGMPASIYPTVVYYPELSMAILPGLKLHELRQRFILSCADFHPEKKAQPSDSVKFIKGILEPFLSKGEAHGLEPSEGHDNPSALRTAFCGVYGFGKVQEAARSKLPSSKYTALLGVAMFKLEALLWDSKIEDLSIRPRIQLALQKVVSKYIFESQVDDDNVCVLISEGYCGALRFLVIHLSSHNPFRFNGVSPGETNLRYSMLRYVVEVIKLLRTEEQLSNEILLYALTLLLDLAACINESCPCSFIDAFDLEVLVNVLLDPRMQSPELSLDFPWTLIKILESVTRIESVKIRWKVLLINRPSLQKVLESFIERSAAYLNSRTYDESAIDWLKGFLTADMNSITYDETSVDWLKEVLAADMNSEELAKLGPLVTIGPIVGTLNTVTLLSELETFGEEKVATTIKSISNHIQALAHSFQQSAERFNELSLGWLHSIISAQVQGVRSVVWSIPGVIESIVSVVCTVKNRRGSRSKSTSLALRILLEWIRLDDGARSQLLSRQGFLDVLLEIIRDHREEYHLDLDRSGRLASVMVIPHRGYRIVSHLAPGPGPWELPHFYAVQILEAFLTSDINAAAASDWASLLDLHPALSDLLVRYTDKNALRRSVFTILLHLGYSLFGRNDTTSCSHLGAVAPQHFQRTDVMIRSRALIVQHGLQNLLDVILKGQSKVERVTAVDLLFYLSKNYSSMRACVYAMPEATTGLAQLLNDDAVDVQELALQTIVIFIPGSTTDLAKEFIRQIALVSGVVERIIKFTRDDGGVKPILAMGFLVSYLLHVKSGNFSHILAIRGMVQDMITWMKNKHPNASKISCTIQFLKVFSGDRSNLSFFLSIRESVEAVVELVAHYTQELQLDGSMKEKTERVCLIERCFDLLRMIVLASEEAIFRIARSGRLLNLTLDLLDKRQLTSVHVDTLQFLAALAGRSANAVFELIERPEFTEKLSFLCHSVHGEIYIWQVTNFAFILAGLKQNVLPEKIVELVWSALEDFLPSNTDGAYVRRGQEAFPSFIRNHKPSGNFLVRAPGVLERLIFLSVHHPQEHARTKALLVLANFLFYVQHYKKISRFLSKVLDALPGILSQREIPDSVIELGSMVVGVFRSMSDPSNGSRGIEWLIELLKNRDYGITIGDAIISSLKVKN